MRRGFCLKCGYNLQGLTSGQCPECGATFDPTDRHTFNLPHFEPNSLTTVSAALLVVNVLNTTCLVGTLINALPGSWGVALLMVPFAAVGAFLAWFNMADGPPRHRGQARVMFVAHAFVTPVVIAACVFLYFAWHSPYFR